MLQRAKSKMLVFLTAVVLAICSVFAGVNLTATPKASADTAGMTYVDTEVASINFYRSGSVIMAFSLTVSDYDDFDPVKDFNSENPGFPEGSAKYNYITSLSYWKNFKTMNSEGGTFTQLFAYWNGGFGDSQIGAVGKNAVAHLTSIKSLEYGFMLQIPAGTTFPSWEYVQSNCKSEPKAYRTTTDVAFYFNGANFEKINYAVAEERVAASEQVGAVDMSLYYAAEQTLVKSLISSAQAELKQCFSMSDIEKTVAKFNENLKTIKTIEDYAKLAAEKDVVKAEMEAFFNALTESAYGAAEWETISLIKAETNVLIDAMETMAQVADVVAGIKYKVGEILTEAEKPAFAEFVMTATANVTNAFDASLYREAEATQGAALVAECAALLASATTYGEAEALELQYLAKIDALKTAAEWDAEGVEDKTETPDVQPEQPDADTDDSKGGIMAKLGCGSSIVETLAIISLAAMATLILILKNKKRMDI